MGCRARILGLALAASGGCATCPAKIQTALARPADRGAEVAGHYTVACPDRLAVQVNGRPDLTRSYVVEPDGCVATGDGGRVRVEGDTPGAAAEALARVWRLPSAR